MIDAVIDNRGKLTLKGHKTQGDEEKTLRNKALLSKINQDNYEKEHEFEMIPILKGYKLRKIN